MMAMLVAIGAFVYLSPAPPPPMQLRVAQLRAATVDADERVGHPRRSCPSRRHHAAEARAEQRKARATRGRTAGRDRLDGRAADQVRRQDRERTSSATSAPSRDTGNGDRAPSGRPVDAPDRRPGPDPTAPPVPHDPTCTDFTGSRTRRPRYVPNLRRPVRPRRRGRPGRRRRHRVLAASRSTRPGPRRRRRARSRRRRPRPSPSRCRRRRRWRRCWRRSSTTSASRPRRRRSTGRSTRSSSTRRGSGRTCSSSSRAGTTTTRATRSSRRLAAPDAARSSRGSRARPSRPGRPDSDEHRRPTG